MNAGFRLDDSALAVELDNPLHRTGVEHHGIARKLLAPHGMTAAGHACGLTLCARSVQRGTQGRLRIDRDDAIDLGEIELGMTVVDGDAGMCATRCVGGEREAGAGPGGQAKKVASRGHGATPAGEYHHAFRRAAPAIDMRARWAMASASVECRRASSTASANWVIARSRRALVHSFSAASTRALRVK